MGDGNSGCLLWEPFFPCSNWTLPSHIRICTDAGLESSDSLNLSVYWPLMSFTPPPPTPPLAVSSLLIPSKLWEMNRILNIPLSQVDELILPLVGPTVNLKIYISFVPLLIFLPLISYSLIWQHFRKIICNLHWVQMSESLNLLVPWLCASTPLASELCLHVPRVCFTKNCVSFTYSPAFY